MHMDYCLDKARRLTHNNEYRLVYKHGKYEVGRMCVHCIVCPWQSNLLALVL